MQLRAASGLGAIEKAHFDRCRTGRLAGDRSPRRTGGQKGHAGEERADPQQRAPPGTGRRVRCDSFRLLANCIPSHVGLEHGAVEEFVQPGTSGLPPMSPLRARLELLAVDAILGGLGALPLRSASALASALTRSTGGLVRGAARTAAGNLARAFPELPPVRRAAILRGAFANLGRLAAEVAHFDELDAGNLRQRVHFASAEVERRFEAAVRGGPAIVATGHLGNWELLVQIPALMGRPVRLVHRAMKNPLVDERLAVIRSRGGTQTSLRHSAARDLLRTLHDGGLIGIPIDQHQPGGTGVPIPFFGRPASTTLGPARLAQLAQVPIYVVGLLRRGDTLEHEIHAGEVIPPPPRGKDPGRLIATMTRVNQQFEALVRIAPEQWLWMHRRWRLD